jgi:nucleotide-binding universal stress UspA family protein
MPETLTKYGILVGVDGSSASDAAVSWAACEASLRHEPVTLIHVVQPLVASGPVSSDQTTVANWRDDQARHIIDRARKSISCALDQPQSSDVRTEVLYSHPVDAIVDASSQGRG